MRILIVASDPELKTQINQIIASFKNMPDQCITVLSVVEPSPVMDITLSVANCNTRFHQILDERMQMAEANLSEFKRSIEIGCSIEVKTKAVFGFVAPATIQTANDLHADMVFVDADCTSQHEMKEILSHSPCSVAFIKPLAKIA